MTTKAMTDKVFEVEVRLLRMRKTVTLLCEDVGISRATWHRWKNNESHANVLTWDRVLGVVDGYEQPKRPKRKTLTRSPKQPDHKKKKK